MKRKHRPPQSATVRHPPAELGQQEAAQPLPSDVDTKRLLHQLQVRQVDLELQNEELQQTRQQLQTALERQTELYDFAPISYLTLEPRGTIRQANFTAASLLGVERAQLLNRRLRELVAAETRPAFDALLWRAFQTKAPELTELRLSIPGKPLVTVKLRAAVSADGRECRVVLEDLAERVRWEQERELIIQLLDRINSTTNLQELMREATRLLRDSTGCEAVGIRLQEGDDFPYFVTTGFPAAFVLAERTLCATDRQGQVRRDNQGRPILECMCGNVLRARYDPTQPFFTANGSFWTNSTTQLLSCTSVTDLPTGTRNRCNREGYESVALIPMRNCGHTFGLLQFNDRRPDRFTPDLIAHLEHLANHLAVALARCQAVEARKQSEERYRRLFETESDAILLLDCATGRIEDVNEAAVKLYGYGRSQFLSLKDVDLSAETQETQNAILTQQTMVPLRLHRKMDGTVFPVEIAVGYFDSSGRKMYVAAIRDITKRKRAEDELRKLSLAVEQSPASVVLTDLLGNIEYVNPRYCRITGYTAEEALGKNPRILKSGKMPAETYTNLWATIVAGKDWDGELLNRKKNGDLFWERAIISPVKDAKGSTTHYLAIKEDITERKRAEEEVRSSREQLRALGFALARAEHRERRRIASLLHDDVIQSLALTRIKLGALRAQLSTSEQQDLLDTLRAHLDQAIRSTRNMTFQLSPPILHELGLEAALSWLAEQMNEQHGLRCECVTESVPAVLDEETASLVFAATRELMLNVVKHARATITRITTHTDQLLLQIIVADDGAGFDAASGARPADNSGGFGLFNIRERLSYLGGQCEVHSAPGQGTQVVLTVPLKRA